MKIKLKHGVFGVPAGTVLNAEPYGGIARVAAEELRKAGGIRLHGYGFYVYAEEYDVVAEPEFKWIELITPYAAGFPAGTKFKVKAEEVTDRKARVRPEHNPGLTYLIDFYTWEYKIIDNPEEEMTIENLIKNAGGLEHKVPMGYLKKGDVFSFKSNKTGRFHYAVADMDGNIVSPDYGTIASGLDTERRSNPHREYINVKFPFFEYTPYGMYGKMNHTIYEDELESSPFLYEDEHDVYVNSETYRRVQRDKDKVEQYLKNKKDPNAAKRAELEKQIADARAKLDEAQKTLEEL